MVKRCAYGVPGEEGRVNRTVVEKILTDIFQKDKRHYALDPKSSTNLSWDKFNTFLSFRGLLK